MRHFSPRAAFTSFAVGLAAVSTAAAAPPVTTPDAHLGRPLGVDFALADWNEVSTYYHRLARESPNALTHTVGTTTEGRDFLVTIISSPANLADLDRIKARSAILADPRRHTDVEKHDAIERGKVIMFVSCAMHSTEAAGAQFGMEFAYHLATSDEEPWRTARDAMVVVIYTTNPDGVDHVTSWYRETVGTPHEATQLLRLYQLYSGHDNNRDWFMLTQAETRIVTRMLYGEWFPQVYWDVHQQGSSRERFFVPPFRDPLNPNLDPAIMTGIDVLGSRALMDMTREGFTGISTGVSYDMWWNGGNRNVPVRHNIIGLLTEAASVRLGSPIFLRKSDLRAPGDLSHYGPSNQFPAPWPGGWWRLRDIIDYEMAFGRSLLGSLSREPAFWRRNSLEASERTIRRGLDEAPRGWIIPSDNRDPAAVRRLIDVLLMSGIELHVTDGPLEADGRTYPAGSIVIRRAQPYGSHVKDLFDVQRYPEGKPPYDVAGWTLSALLGVRRVEVMQAIDVPLTPAGSTARAVAAFVGDPRADGAQRLSTAHSDTWTRAVKALADGTPVTLVGAGDAAGLLRVGTSGTAADAADGADAAPGTARADAADDVKATLTAARLPRIGLYTPWTGSMDEGWTRYVLDTFEIPYVRVRNEMLRAGALGDFLDVLVVPSVGARQLDRGRDAGSVADEYAGGLAPEGAVAVEEFVRGGGRLIALGASAAWAVDLLEIPVVDATRDADAKGFACPGSVVRTIPETAPLTAGLPPSVAVFFSGSSAWRPMSEKEREDAERADDWDIDTLVRYAPSRVLLSGWIERPEVIEGEGAWVRARYGEGIVDLFGFRPQYRGWSQGAFSLLFRAMLF